MKLESKAHRAPLAPRLLRVERAAKLLGISRSTAYELVASGELRSIKVGARRLVPVDELDGFVARRLPES